MDKKIKLIPRFVVEGFAVLKDGDFYADDGNDGLDIVYGIKPGFAEMITIKPNAPLWAIDEYEQLLKFYKALCDTPAHPNHDYSLSTNFTD